MQSTHKIHFLITLFISISLWSCNKHKVNVNFSINQPIAAKTYNAGDTVKILGSITADAEIHGYQLNITNKSSGAVVFTKALEEHNSTFTLNEFWINNVASATDMTLEVKAIIDHDGESESTTVNFHCHN